MSKGLSKEDTKQEHPLQAIVLCDGWGEEERWGPLVRRATEDEVASQTVGENRPWVSTLFFRLVKGSADDHFPRTPVPPTATHHTITSLDTRVLGHQWGGGGFPLC